MAKQSATASTLEDDPNNNKINAINNNSDPFKLNNKSDEWLLKRRQALIELLENRSKPIESTVYDKYGLFTFNSFDKKSTHITCSKSNENSRKNEALGNTIGSKQDTVSIEQNQKTLTSPTAVLSVSSLHNSTMPAASVLSDKANKVAAPKLVVKFRDGALNQLKNIKANSSISQSVSLPGIAELHSDHDYAKPGKVEDSTSNKFKSSITIVKMPTPDAQILKSSMPMTSKEANEISDYELTDDNEFSDFISDGEEKRKNQEKNKYKWCVCEEGNNANIENSLCKKCNLWFHVKCVSNQKEDGDLICFICKPLANQKEVLVKFKSGLKFRNPSFSIDDISVNNKVSNNASKQTKSIEVQANENKKRKSNEPLPDLQQNKKLKETSLKVLEKIKQPNKMQPMSSLASEKSQKKFKSIAHAPPIKSKSPTKYLGSPIKMKSKINSPKKINRLSFNSNTVLSKDYSSASASKATTSTVKPGLPASFESVREALRNSIKDALKMKIKKAIEISWDDEIAKNDGDLDELVKHIDEEIYKAYQKDTSKYRNRGKSLLSNIKEPKNDTFYRKILNGKLSPAKLATMNILDMASDAELLKRKEEFNEEINLTKQGTLELYELKKSMPFKKTHKGDHFEVELPIFSDEFGSESSLDTPSNQQPAVDSPSANESLAAISVAKTALSSEKNLQPKATTSSRANSSSNVQPITNHQPIVKNNLSTNAKSSTVAASTTSLSKTFPQEPLQVDIPSAISSTSLSSSSSSSTSLHKSVSQPEAKSPARPLSIALQQNQSDEVFSPTFLSPTNQIVEKEKNLQKKNHDSDFESEDEINKARQTSVKFVLFNDDYIPPTSPTCSGDEQKQDELFLSEWFGSLFYSSSDQPTECFVRANFLLSKALNHKTSPGSIFYNIYHNYLRKIKTPLKLSNHESKLNKNESCRIFDYLIKIKESKETCFIKFEPANNSPDVKKSWIDLVKNKIMHCDDQTIYDMLHKKLLNKMAKNFVFKVHINQEYNHLIENFFIIGIKSKQANVIDEACMKNYNMPLIRDKDYLIGCIIPAQNKSSSKLSSALNTKRCSPPASTNISKDPTGDTSNPKKRKLENELNNLPNKKTNLPQNSKNYNQNATSTHATNNPQPNSAHITKNVQPNSVHAPLTTVTTVSANRDPRLERRKMTESSSTASLTKSVSIDASITSSGSKESLCLNENELDKNPTPETESNIGTNNQNMPPVAIQAEEIQVFLKSVLNEVKEQNSKNEAVSSPPKDDTINKTVDTTKSSSNQLTTISKDSNESKLTKPNVDKVEKPTEAYEFFHTTFIGVLENKQLIENPNYFESAVSSLKKYQKRNLLSKKEAERLINEFKTKLPSQLLSVIDEKLEPMSADMSLESDDDQSSSDAQSIPQKMALPMKEKWCGESEEQFKEMLRLAHINQINPEIIEGYSFNNDDWNVGNFKINRAPFEDYCRNFTDLNEQDYMPQVSNQKSSSADDKQK